ncbi:MAG: hypothetical protein ACRDGG_01890 [Anaerolineae bacterium]
MPVKDLQAELEARRDLVARLEQERTDLHIEIDVFQQMVTARLGPAQAELEALDLHIAEYRLRNEWVRLRGGALDANKLDAEIEWQMRGRRERFAGYQESVRRAETAARMAHTASDVPVQPSAAPSTSLRARLRTDLKSMYRDLAKRVHPDLAVDEADRAARSALMAEINDAYARSDLSALGAILAQVSGSSLPQAGAGDAKWLRAEIDRLDQVIASMRAEIAELNRSDWMAMKLDAALARSRGIDWFDRARREIAERAADRRAELDALIADFRELVRQAGMG